MRSTSMSLASNAGGERLQASGHFNDGQTAARRRVSVAIVGKRLEFREREGTQHWAWPLEDLRRVGEERRGEDLILTYVETPGEEDLADARLVIQGAAFRAALLEAAPQLKGARIRRRAIWRPAALTLLVAAGLVAFVLYGLRPAAQAVAAAVPVSWEVALGDSVYEQVLDYFSLLGMQEPRACVAEPGQRALEALTATLAEGDEIGYPYRVVVLDDGMVNAFALPGGRIVLFKGLIDFSERPEEVAAVLSHEMAHIIAQHGVARIMEQFGLTILLDFVTGGGGVITGGAAVILGLSYSRHDEREADRLGIDLLNQAGIQSDGLASFFERFARQHGTEDSFGEIGNILSTHPADGERIEAGRAAARDGRPALTAEEWQSLRQICSVTESPLP